MAFVISVGGALRVTGAGQTRACGAWACFAWRRVRCATLVSFASLRTRDGGSRNFYAYSTFAMLLVVTGCGVLLTGCGAGGGVFGLGRRGARGGVPEGPLHAAAARRRVSAAGGGRGGMVPRATERIIRTGGGVEGAVQPAYALALLGAALCYAALAAQERRRAALDRRRGGYAGGGAGRLGRDGRGRGLDERGRRCARRC